MNRIKNYSQLADDITSWIKDYAQKNNIQSLVVGVSGGIDSAVVSTLCARTGLFTWCAVLPIHSNDEHVRIAKDHIYITLEKYKNVGRESLDLSTVYDELYKVIKGQHGSELIWANTKSRLRMTTLYCIAGHMNGIVVGTGNKVEDFGIQFFTKYGDGGVDISPIADLYKTEVRELGRYLGVSEEIINAQPTDGLFEDSRTDEMQIGATYEELEYVMNSYEKHGKLIHDQCSALSKKRIAAEEIYLKLNKKGQHKVQPIPIFKLQEQHTI